MPEFDLAFSSSLTDDAGAFKLLELPPDLCKLIEARLEASDPLRLCIKGHSGDDAVLCTDENTYSIRSVALSNSVLVVTPSDTDTVVISDQVNEILELTPAVPKLQKLTTLCENPPEEEEEASDAEIARGLRDQRILDVHGALRPIAPAFLSSILESILNLLVSQSMSPQSVPAEELAATLADESEISRTVSSQVMAWFGEVSSDGKWKMDIGLGILRQYKGQLLKKWKSAVGDTFENSVSLPLLSGNYLASSDMQLTYFPCSASPVDPTSRFTDLFLTRPRWKADEIVPFLSDIAVSTKERDKLLLKYGRATTDSQGVWYTKK
ncbi:hypothetical protein FB45DRAFT_904169 [Roridomyces roridus]|uniref:Sister chromatid cohesion protein DCC1 n=1 Tax=Roridomyces roridus TaxID=1738132 RepID=A0AAD7C6I5_9AGAR|nr:hypothetical protein FB45DRAFT_904169 [Roridomyces roridus]